MVGKSLLGLCPFLLLTMPSAEGAVVFSDAFSYPDGALVLVSNGKWKTHSGVEGQVEVVSGQVRLSQKQSEDVNGLFAGGVIGPGTATALYASFKVNFMALPTGANGAYFAHFKDTAATTGLRCRIFACTNGAAPGTFRVGIAAAASNATAWLAQDLKLNTAYRLMCRMVLANNASTLWLSPRSENDPSVTSTDEASVKPAASFAFRQSLASSHGMGELTVDDLVVATSFAECLQSRPAAMVTEPADQTVAAGEDVVFTVEAEGSEPLFFQWFWNGMEIPGATHCVLLLPCVALEQAGEYQVLVSNSLGSAASYPAFLSVEPRGPPITIARDGPASIKLSWPAEWAQTYSVWVADSVTTGFVPVAMDLWFPEGAGWFEEGAAEVPGRFYRICSP